MHPDRKTSLIFGLFFAGTFVFSIPALFFYDPVLHDAGYILEGGFDTRISTGALFEILLAICNIATAIILFPIVKRVKEAVALGYVASRIVESVIKAFNNIFAKSLHEKGVPKGTTGRIGLSVAGDSSGAKAAVLRLIDDLGFDPVDGGDLDNSWRQQAGTPAYCQDLEAAALRRALSEAVRSRIAEYRSEEEARIKKYMAAQTAKG